MPPANDPLVARPLLLRTHEWLQLIVRVLLALFFITYGVAKLLGTQFIRSGHLLDLPIGEVSGFELTWAYFGYAPLYSHAVAAGQIVFAALLLFDRTKRLAMLGLLAIVANIVLVNFGYHISTATKVVSSVFLAMNLYLVISEFGALKRFFWDETAPDASSARPRMAPAVGLGILVVALSGSLLFITWLRSSEMTPTALSGDWLVEEVFVDGGPVDPTAPLGGSWEKVHFEDAGLFGVRTDRGIVLGRYEVDAAAAQVVLDFDPAPRRRSAQAYVAQPLAAAEGASHLDADAAAPDPSVVIMAGYYLAADRTRLTLNAVHDGKRYELRLVPWQWLRY